MEFIMSSIRKERFKSQTPVLRGADESVCWLLW